MLLDIYNSNDIYLCKNNYMKTKIFAHMQRTNAFCLIEKVNEKNSTCVRQHLDHITKHPPSPSTRSTSRPTIGIARYISHLLEPVYDQMALSTTFFKETDVVHTTEMYANKGLLLSTTLFATFHIDDLSTVLSHEEIMQSLECFLNQYYKPDEYSQGISIDTIIKLIHIVLQNQIFIFENKVYRQFKGAATESSLTILLMNIYMFY
ncbi:unnamed protein product [Didymodactylos carnosus]|uniref:Uncharacterized protein n=1 Tax=Didymodactylos carnosus TaxID=1234261 RepID=A0A8S2EIG3_9BILA|nr:unnamed protein product [Didymodactylos carnosus]CAF3960228.1 unnamed protein product [Didymodactylos carnosus]